MIDCKIIISDSSLMIHQRTKPARHSPLAVRKHHLMITIMKNDCQSIIIHDSSAYKTCTTIPLGRPATVPPVFGTSRTLVTWFSSGSFQIVTREGRVFAAVPISSANIKMKSKSGADEYEKQPGVSESELVELLV